MAIAGHLMGGLVSNTWGRRTGALAVCPLFVLGWLCYWLWESVTGLFIGRLMFGLACGMQHTAVASYIRCKW